MPVLATMPTQTLPAPDDKDGRNSFAVEHQSLPRCWPLQSVSENHAFERHTVIGSRLLQGMDSLSYICRERSNEHCAHLILVVSWPDRESIGHKSTVTCIAPCGPRVDPQSRMACRQSAASIAVMVRKIDKSDRESADGRACNSKQITSTLTDSRVGILPATRLLNLNTNWNPIIDATINWTVFTVNVTNKFYHPNDLIMYKSTLS